MPARLACRGGWLCGYVFAHAHVCVTWILRGSSAENTRSSGVPHTARLPITEPEGDKFGRRTCSVQYPAPSPTHSTRPTVAQRRLWDLRFFWGWAGAEYPVVAFVSCRGLRWSCPLPPSCTGCAKGPPWGGPRTCCASLCCCMSGGVAARCGRRLPRFDAGVFPVPRIRTRAH